jgi:8-oxo-dGTP pyrophosphatase MutT (NUDIX family)
MIYLDKLAEELNIRPRVELYLYDDMGRVLASKLQDGHSNSSSTSWKFPGGGIEEEATINQTAKREAMEEAGYTANTIHGIGKSPAVTVWPEFHKAYMASNKNRKYDAERTYYRAGKIGNRNTKLLGADGDTLKNPELVPISTVISDLEKASRDPNNKYRAFDKARLAGISSLKDHLDSKKLTSKMSMLVPTHAVLTRRN